MLYALSGMLLAIAANTVQYTTGTATLIVVTFLVPSAISLSQTVKRASALPNTANAKRSSALESAKENRQSAGWHAMLGAEDFGASAPSAKVQYYTEASHFSIQPNGFISC